MGQVDHHRRPRRLYALAQRRLPGPAPRALRPPVRRNFSQGPGLPRPLGIPIRGDGTNPVSLLLPNQARLVALPGGDATIRGFSAVSLLVLDEASRIPDETYFAVRPMLAANPKAVLCAVSTPHGQQGFFYEAWTNGGTLWQRFHVPATECPRLSPAFLAEEKFGPQTPASARNTSANSSSPTTAASPLT
ncbi:MAG: hypothetical protein IPM24_14015 [Bryobacterales bacterium]|nr:hypothetical protein [Bryobacterales bacterium]